MSKIQQRIAAAERRTRDAERQLAEARTQCDHISDILDETRNLREMRDSLSAEQRATVLQYWVHSVLISVIKQPVRKRGHPRCAIVTLRRLPKAYFLVGLDPSSADLISELTHGSDSSTARPRSAADAPGDDTRPSAHAACPRTNGSGSESAEVSTGTASGDPQLPSATQTLRAKPARPARRIADPLENDSQAPSDRAIESNSTSEGESVPGCDPDDRARAASTPTGRSPAPRAA